MNAQTDSAQRWWHRLLKVVYTISLLISLITAVSTYIAILWNDSEIDRWMFFSVLAGVVFGITLVFEVLRRTTFYVTSGRDFLSRHFPKHIKILVAVSIFLLIIGGVAYVVVDMPQNAIEEAKRDKLYAESKGKLQAAETALTACIDGSIAAKDAAAAEKIKECERQRDIQRGLYNDCRAGGYSSHAFCISLYDYEAIKCDGLSGLSYANFLYLNSCRSERDNLNSLKDFITEYEADHQ